MSANKTPSNIPAVQNGQSSAKVNQRPQRMTQLMAIINDGDDVVRPVPVPKPADSPSVQPVPPAAQPVEMPATSVPSLAFVKRPQEWIPIVDEKSVPTEVVAALAPVSEPVRQVRAVAQMPSTAASVNILTLKRRANGGFGWNRAGQRVRAVVAWPRARVNTIILRFRQSSTWTFDIVELCGGIAAGLGVGLAIGLIICASRH